ncbi:MAG: Shikimate kinase [Verrucomicrobiae bacterium]|nr:Shikimate kinase [Verrucomicrobiae bacterium]
MKNLVLVGFMGSGKSSAGRLVASRLGLQFVDMDAVIEERVGQTIPAIFETQGEAIFRQHERALAQELAGQSDQVIATGGGIVLNPDNIADFSRTGIVVCFWISPEAAFERTKHTRHRPLLEAEADRQARIVALLKKREPLYRAIPIQIDVSQMTVTQQADALERIYRERN